MLLKFVKNPSYPIHHQTATLKSGDNRTAKVVLFP